MEPNSKIGAAAAAAMTDLANNMTQEVFNWIARSVNKDFMNLGYPGILTKKAGRDFVSLSALMQNCSALLDIVKAKRSQLLVGPSAAGAAAGGSGAAEDSVGGGCSSAAEYPQADKCEEKSEKSKHDKKRNSSSSRSWFTSSAKGFKRLQRESAATQARLAAEAPLTASAKMMVGGDAITMTETAELATLRGIARTVRRDTEAVIAATGCLKECQQKSVVNAAAEDCNHAEYFAHRWPAFREAATGRMLAEARRPCSKGLSSNTNQHHYHQGSGGSHSQHDTDAGPKWSRPSRGGQRSLSRPRAGQPDVGNPGSGGGSGLPPLLPAQPQLLSATRVPALEAEVRRLKLELSRREQRHKAELDRQARDRERMERDFHRAQRRTPGPRWPSASGGGGGGSASGRADQARDQAGGRLTLAGSRHCSTQRLPQQHQQPQLQSAAAEATAQDKTLEEVVDTVERLAAKLELDVTVSGLKTHQVCADIGHRQQLVREYIETVCATVQARFQALQADCQAARRRQAHLEALTDILRARLHLTCEQLADAVKFEVAIADIARRSGAGAGAAGTSASVEPRDGSAGAAAFGGGDEHREVVSLVSRLTNRLRERQRPSV